MTQYFIPGPMSPETQRHLRDLAEVVQQASITTPLQVDGYIIPERESECRQFLTLAGLTEADFRNPRETNIPNVFLVNFSSLISTIHYEGNCPRVKKTLEEIALTTGGVDIVVVEPNECCFYVNDYFYRHRCPSTHDEALYIHFNCGNQGRELRTEALTRLYDIDLTTRLPLNKVVRSAYLLPNSQGPVITDTHGTAVAQVVDGNIYILVNIMQHSVREPWNAESYTVYWKYNAHILELILRDAIPIALAQRPKKEKKDPILEMRTILANNSGQAEDDFVRLTTRSREREITRALREVNEHEGYVEELRRQWLSRVNSLNNALRHLNDLRSLPHDTGEGRRTEFQHILAMPEVIGIAVPNNETVCVYTDTIYIDYEGMQYQIGNFQIDINHQADSIRVTNLNNTAGRRFDYHHPHINYRGSMCTGDASEAINTALVNDEFEMLVTIILQFLKSYHSSGAYISINNWRRIV